MGITVQRIEHFVNGTSTSVPCAGTSWWLTDGRYNGVTYCCRITIKGDAYGATSIGVGGLSKIQNGNRPLLLNVSDSSNPNAFIGGSGLPGVPLNDNGAGSIAINITPYITPDDTYYVWLYAYSGDWSHRYDTTNLVVTSGGTYGTDGVVSANNGAFGSPISMAISNGSAGASYTVTVSCAGRTETLQTQSVNTNLTWTPDLATYAALLPNSSSATATITCTTYYAGVAHTPTTKNITVGFADGSLSPTLSSGWASHAYYNAGTGAAGIAAYVQGYSKAQVTFDSSKITCQYGASVASYEIVCNGETASSSPYLTPVLTGTTASVVCTVIDSRGQRASSTLTVTLNEYSTPSITFTRIYRSDSSAVEDADGQYISAQANVSISTIGGLNTYTLSAYSKDASASSYASQGSMTSGVIKTMSGFSPDASYDIKIVLTDSLNNTTEYNERVQTRKWAMKFRDGGDGVAFGKAAEHDKELEIPGDWKILFGDKSIHPDMLGATEAGSTASTSHAAGEYFLWDNSFVQATAAISVGGNIASSVRYTSIADELAALSSLGVVDMLGDTESGSTATTSHEAGSFFIWSGQFVQATSAISVGDNISSYVRQTTVADELTKLADDTLYTGTLTKIISSGTADNLCCVKKGGVVTVGGRVHTFSQAGAAITFFSIPDGFRPPAAVTCLAGYLVGGGVGWVMMPVSIGTNGNVTGGYSPSTSYPVQQFSFSCSYHI